MLGASCPGQFILPPTWVLKVIFYAHLTCFIQSEYEFITIIIIIQMKLSCFLSLVHTLCCRGWGKLSRAVYLAPDLGI